MAADFGKKKKEKFDYAAAVSELKTQGPNRLYLLYGEEDYLRELYFTELAKLCVEGDDGFNRRRLNGPNIDLRELDEAINALPFFADHTLVEVWDFDINKCKESQADTLKKLLADIPDYCTVVFILSASYDVDARLSVFKTLKKLGTVIDFTSQGQSQILNWIARRFGALGKKIGRPEAERLVFLSGGLMNSLIPEIEKIAGYARDEVITMYDVDTVAHHLPEAVVFEMTDALAARDYDKTAVILAELLQMRDEHPIKILAMIGQHMRNLYAARVCIDQKLGKQELMDICHIRFDFIAEKLMKAAKGFSLEQLTNGVEACAACDYAMKSSGADDNALLRGLLVELAAGGRNNG